eukprot:g32755.t1
MIHEVAAGSLASLAGMRSGDVILAVNGKPVRTPNDLVRHSESGEKVHRFLVRRQEKIMYLTAADGVEGIKEEERQKQERLGKEKERRKLMEQERLRKNLQERGRASVDDVRAANQGLRQKLDDLNKGSA